MKTLDDDKFKHDQAGMLISGLASSTSYFFGLNAWQSTGVGFLSSAVVGGLKEIYDMNGHGVADVHDFISTAFGGARMSIFWRIGVHENEKRRNKIDTLKFQNL